MSKRSRAFSREFKLMAVRRLLAGEKMSVVAQWTKVLAKDLYTLAGSLPNRRAEALRGWGRPRRGEALVIAKPGLSAGEAAVVSRAACRCIAELKRKIDHQRVEVDFFGKPCGRSRRHAGRATGLALGLYTVIEAMTA
jgi:transposase